MIDGCEYRYCCRKMTNYRLTALKIRSLLIFGDKILDTYSIAWAIAVCFNHTEAFGCDTFNAVREDS